MKPIFTTLSLLCSFGIAHAQTKIYPRNNLRFIPAATFNLHNFTNDYSVGISYERAIDNRFSWSLPVYFGARQVNESWYSGPITYKNVFKINPGITFYPFGQRRLTYGMGLSVLYMRGLIKEDLVYDNGRYRLNQFGFMVNNSLTCNITNRINLNIGIGFGPSLLNQYKDIKYHNINNNNKGDILSLYCVQAGVGYRF